MCAINLGSRRTKSPLSAIANFCRFLIRQSGQGTRAGRMYHDLIACGSEYGVVKSWFDLCSPRAQSVMPNT